MICGPCQQGQHDSCVGPESCACARDRRCQACIDGSHVVCKNPRICPCAKKGHPDQPEFRVLNLPRAIDILRAARDDPNTPMHVAANISQVLVECLDDRGDEF